MAQEQGIIRQKLVVMGEIELFIQDQEVVSTTSTIVAEKFMCQNSKYVIWLFTNIICASFAYGAELNKLPNGDTFYGDFVNGNKQGIGAYTYKNGDISVGEYLNDRCNGFFLHTKKNGEQFYQVCNASGTSSLAAISFDATAGAQRNPHPSKWYLTGFSSESISLIDMTSIKRQGNISTFWSLMNFQNASNSPSYSALSILTKTQVDCSNDSMRALYSYWYPERDGKGAFSHELNHEALRNGDSIWKPVPPTSDARFMVKKACKR
jgi:hypothetical protein